MNEQERKSMEQALEALESALSDDKPYIDKSKAAITALRQAIAEAEKQERNFCERCGKRLGKHDWDIHTCTPPALTSQPPKREWVELTDEAIWREYQRLWPFHPAEEPRLAKDITTFARAIDAKLKEKNA